MTNISAKINNNKLKINFSLDTRFNHSDTQSYIEGLLNNTVEGSINPIEDFEVKDFVYDGDTLDFHIFFHRDLKLNDFGLINEMDSSFNNYQKLLLKELSLDSTYGDDQISKIVSNYVSGVTNTNSSDKTILITGATATTDNTFPGFYNSFVFPFYSENAGWLNNSRKFKDQPFLYNSFLKIDFFSTPNKLTQQTLFSQVINVNPRYCLKEYPLSGEDTLRPSFTLDEEKDGFHLYWLNDYPLSEFYALFRFWDAYNGNLYNLIPSTDSNTSKKWVQNSESFNQKKLFLKYKINYETQKFDIFEYDEELNDWVIKASSFDLYQLVYNNTYADNPPNIKINRETEATKQTVIVKPKYSAELTNDSIKSFYEKDLTGLDIEQKREFYRQNSNFSENIGKTYIKNTGTGNLYLQDINITWLGKRITNNFTTENLRSDFNEEPKFFQKNFITYSDLVTRTDQFFGKDLPVKKENVGLDYNKERYGEKFTVKYNGDYNTIIEPGKFYDIDFLFQLGKQYFWSYIDIPFRTMVSNVSYIVRFRYKVDILLSDVKVTETNSSLLEDIKKTIIINYPFKIISRNADV
jgi:hypothetical protein